MNFLKADVNFQLLGIVLVVAAAFVSFSVYYQNEIKKMQNEYVEAVQNLKGIEKKLLIKEEKLNEISRIKESIAKDKESLEIGYLSLQDENDGLVQKFESAPLAKALCRTTGNVKCLN